MRVLLVEFTSAVSGGERSLLELAQGLCSEHEVILACPAGPLAELAAELGLPVLAIPPSQLTFRLHPLHTARGLADMVRAAWRLRGSVRTLRPAIVHANSIRAGLLAMPAAVGLSPVVVHCRDVMPAGPAGAAVRAVVLAGAARVVAISEHVATRLAGGGWAGRRVTVVANAVDMDRFDPATISAGAVRASLALGDRTAVVSVIGQITPWKAQDLAIRTVAELRGRGLDVVLLVVGEAKFVGHATRYDNRAFERELHALVEALGLGDRVRFLGERPDPERILAATDVLLVPSTEEPFGRTIIEAMAMGVPVAATSAGGPAEILRDAIGGRVVRGRDEGAWADAVEELLVWSPERAAAARAAAAARFSRERHTTAMLAVYAAAGPVGPPSRTARLMTAGRRAAAAARSAWRAVRHVSTVTLDWRLDGCSASGVLYRLWTWQLWRRTVRRAVLLRCFDGSLLLAPPWSRMASHIAATGLTERDEAFFVLDLVRPGDLFVDVGANIGFYTMLAARRGARVLAFEPSPQTAVACRNNVMLNGLGSVVSLREAACGGAVGRIGFSTGLDITNHIVVRGDGDLDVELTKLDVELAAEAETPTMLKIDAEGHELDVLRGSLEILRRLVPVIMIEVWAGGVAERGLLEPMGYRAYRYDASGRRLEPIPPQFAGQANLLFVCAGRLEAVADRLVSSTRPRLSPPSVRWRLRRG